MTTHSSGPSRPDSPGDERRLSLYRLLDPSVGADPYELYRQLQTEDPVHWDPFLHTWVVTRYDDVMTVLQNYSAARTPTPEQLAAPGMEDFSPVAELMVRQMLYLDPPQHTRVRALAAKGFTPPRVETLRDYVTDIVAGLLDAVHPRRTMDVIADFARPLPAIVSCEMLGLPTVDWPQLSTWTRSFAELLGNFQPNPLRTATVKKTVDDMTLYFRDAVRDQAARGDGLLYGAENFSEDELVANAIITLVGGLETTTNLIGNGLFTLLQEPAQWALLREDPTLIPPAIEELLRFESPIQHTARLAPEDTELGGRLIRERQAITAVMAAANRDPARFTDPDRLDVRRVDNRHLAFGWSTHHCFGAPLARLVAQLAFAAIVERLGSIGLAGEPVRWRQNAGVFRGLESLCVEF